MASTNPTLQGPNLTTMFVAMLDRNKTVRWVFGQWTQHSTNHLGFTSVVICACATNICCGIFYLPILCHFFQRSPSKSPPKNTSVNLAISRRRF